MKFFKNFKITATADDIDRFVLIDNENSHMFKEEILEEVNCFFLETASGKWRWEYYVITILTQKCVLSRQVTVFHTLTIVENVSNDIFSLC